MIILSYVSVTTPEYDSDPDTINRILNNDMRLWFKTILFNMKSFLHFFSYATGFDLFLKELRKPEEDDELKPK